MSARVYYHVAISSDHVARYSPEAASLEEIAEWWPDRVVTTLVSGEDHERVRALLERAARAVALVARIYDRVDDSGLLDDIHKELDK